MREHLVSWCEPRHVLADRGDDTRRFDAECQRWLPADVPFSDADELVPVADPGRPHRDPDLVRRRRRRRRELQHSYVSAEGVNPGRLHPSHSHHLEDPRARESWIWESGLSNLPTPVGATTNSNAFTWNLAVRLGNTAVR
jgi:hypothetical protein